MALVSRNTGSKNSGTVVLNYRTGGSTGCGKSILNMMDVFVLPSHYEGLSLALIEAQANGLPCFTSSNVTNEEAITKKIEFIPLEKTPLQWALTICSSKNRRDYNDNMNEQVQTCGFDIKDRLNDLKGKYYWI